MTLKTKQAKKKSNNGDSVNQLVSSGFTLSENFVMDQIDNSKKTRHAAKTSESDKKIGTMFKVKENVEMEDEEPSAKKTKKGSSKKAPATEVSDIADSDLPGFEAPKPKKAPVKRKSDHGEGNEEFAQKMPKPDWKEIKEKNKALKEDRKKKGAGNRYDLSIRAKKLWEDLRREDTPKDKQLSLSAELYKLTKGHAKEVLKTFFYCL